MICIHNIDTLKKQKVLMVVEGIRVLLSDGKFSRGGLSRRYRLSPNSSFSKWKSKTGATAYQCMAT